MRREKGEGRSGPFLGPYSLSLLSSLLQLGSPRADDQSGHGRNPLAAVQARRRPDHHHQGREPAREHQIARAHQVSTVPMAAARLRSMGVLERGWTGAAVQRVRDGVAYVRDPRPLPRLFASVAVDVVLELRQLVAA